MRNLILSGLAVLLLHTSCHRVKEDFIVEYSGGEGVAYSLLLLPDSGFLSCGSVADKAFLMRSSRLGKKIFDYSSAHEGAFRSVWYDTAFIIAGGSSQSQLLLTKLTPDGTVIWEKIVASGVPAGMVTLFGSDMPGELVALCGPDQDSGEKSASGFYVVRFDTSGVIIDEKMRTLTGTVYFSGAVMTGDGGYVTAVTRVAGTAKPRASVMRLNNSLATLWECELMNNPSYGAVSLDICNMHGGYAVSGRTELVYEGSLLDNSFVSGISEEGRVLWRKYPENSNEGVSVARGEGDLVYLLNRNCYIVNILAAVDGSDYSRIRTFKACDPYNTSTSARTLILNHYSMLIMAGSRSGKYYVLMKPHQGEKMD